MFISLLRGKRAVFTHTCSDAFSLKHCELHPGGLNYSLALQRHTGQTAVLQALTLGQMRSNDHLTTKIFVDNFLLSTLSIMSTNRCSPSSRAFPNGSDHPYPLGMGILE